MKKISYIIFIFLNLSLILPSGYARADNEPLSYILDMARQTKDPFSQAEALLEISAAYTELNDYNNAQRILSEALNIAQNIKDPTSKAMLLYGLVDKYVGFNANHEKALQIAKSIEFPDVRSDALVNIINRYYIHQDNYERTLELAEGIDEYFAKAFALSKLINRAKEQKLYGPIIRVWYSIKKTPPQFKKLIWMLASEDFNKISEKQIINFLTLKSPIRRVRALISALRESLSFNSYDSVREILDEIISLSRDIQSDYLRSEVLAQAASAYVQIKDTEKALEAVENIRVAFYRSKALGEIAINYARALDFDKTLQMINGMESEYIKEDAAAKILIIYTEADKQAEANKVLASLGKGVSKDRIYYKISCYHTQNEAYEKAIKTGALIDDPLLKIRALLYVAKELQIKQNLTPELRETLSKITIHENR